MVWSNNNYILNYKILLCISIYIIMSISNLLVQNDYNLIINESTTQTSTVNNMSIVDALNLNYVPTVDNTQTQIMVRNSTSGLLESRNNIVDTDDIQTLTNKILTQPTISQILNGTGTLTLPANTNATLATTNDLLGMVTQTGSQTLTNKTINTNGPNSILVNNILITDLINQDVRSTASPLFVNPAARSLSLNNSIGSKKYEKVVWSVTSTDNSVLDVLTINVNNNSAATVTTTCTFYVSIGTNINKAGSRIFTTRGSNVAGSVTMSGTIQNLSNNEGGLNGVTINHSAIINTIRVTFAGLIGDTMFASGTTEIFYN